MGRRFGIIALVAATAALSLLPGGPSASQGVGQLVTTASPKPGDLDPRFDGDGKVITDFGGWDYLGGVAVQADGKIVAVGGSSPPGPQARDFVLARYNADGSLDSGFGSGGKVRTDLGSRDDLALAVAIQPDGKIVVAGWATHIPGVTNAAFALARYNPDGTLDSSFGGRGWVLTNLPGPEHFDYARDLAIQADGKIVVVGATRGASGYDYDFAVVRYNPNGSLDTSFGGAGYLITPFSSARDIAEAVLIQPDGKIVAAGIANRSGAAGPGHVALARYNPDGRLDGSFDGDGKVEGEDPVPDVSSVAIQADGKLVVAGGMVARFKADGSLDTGFGSTWLSAFVTVVLVQPDRKLVVAGYSSADFLVARLRPDGAKDTSFGDSGQVRTDLATNSYDQVNGAALQSDGRIVVAGMTEPTHESPSDFALARYLNPPPCRVPNVRGKKLAVARSAITKAHCSVGKVKRKASKRVKRNRVVSQSPKAGTQQPNLGKVNLVVSRGRK